MNAEERNAEKSDEQQQQQSSEGEREETNVLFLIVRRPSQTLFLFQVCMKLTCNSHILIAARDRGAVQAERRRMLEILLQEKLLSRLHFYFLHDIMSGRNHFFPD